MHFTIDGNPNVYTFLCYPYHQFISHGIAAFILDFLANLFSIDKSACAYDIALHIGYKIHLTSIVLHAAGFLMLLP